jgi:hypothetical protein
MTITTTLSAIRAASPYEEDWGTLTKYGLKTEIPVSVVLESSGIDDALWVLYRACGDAGVKASHTFACDAAEHVLHIYEKHVPGDDRVRNAIAVKRLWIAGEASDDDLDAARAAAWGAARAAAWGAARAADAASAAADTAWGAAGAAATAGAAAGAAAWEAAGAAATAGAADTAWEAAGAAAAAAASAWDAECVWQVSRLKELLK